MQTTLHLELRHSRWLVAYLLLAHLAGAFLVWAVPLPPWAPIGLTMALVASLLNGLAQHAGRRHPLAVSELRLRQDFTVEAQTHGQWYACTLSARSYIGTRLVILSLRAAEWRWPRTVILLPDNIEPNLFRRVRIWLRWGYTEMPADGLDPLALPDKAQF